MGFATAVAGGTSSRPGAREQPGQEADQKPRAWRMGDAYEQRLAHHDGIKQLWESKWRRPCSLSVYPFHDGRLEDFEPVFRDLIERKVADGTGADYTEAFFPAAAALTQEADDAADPVARSELYLRAACLYRIARFPYISAFPRVSDASKWRAWTLQKDVYLRAASRWENPVSEVLIPHVHRAGEERRHIPTYVRLPTPRLAGAQVPAVLLMTGLDGYRPDNTTRSDEFLARGWASVMVEIPGTADCPADPTDPAASERLWSSVLLWMEAGGRIDMQRIIVWGLSAGGYHAVRIAHTHRHQLRAVVAQGAGVHHCFDRDWIAKADGHEYPFQLSPAMAAKHGYATVEEYTEHAQKRFSLLEAGMLDQPSTRLLLINGTHDGLMPIEDSMLLFEHGTPKEARFFDKALHMGYPMANSAVYPWMEAVMA
ncbi:unnamed protein product [Diplocarpon coronariae]|uniref:Pigment biosynthesis protein yellowish-green n=1 Tax=Diplocarpon coronariae TaxID=2795749 RepID=A0A218ZAS6_9HELO|nr:pigment biosynthesis protein yellowish-green [Marssonina coronariae]